MDHNIHEWLEWRDKAIIEQAKEIEYLRELLAEFTCNCSSNCAGVNDEICAWWRATEIVGKRTDTAGDENEAVKAIRETTERVTAKCFDDMIKEIE